jgi:hypothetical protein
VNLAGEMKSKAMAALWSDHDHFRRCSQRALVHLRLPWLGQIDVEYLVWTRGYRPGCRRFSKVDPLLAERTDDIAKLGAASIA